MAPRVGGPMTWRVLPVHTIRQIGELGQVHAKIRLVLRLMRTAF
jgi:hypothetical protein